MYPLLLGVSINGEKLKVRSTDLLQNTYVPLLTESFFCCMFYIGSLIAQAILLRHKAQVISLGFDCWVEKPCYRRKTPLAVGGTWTQVLADRMAIAARALNQCTTLTPVWGYSYNVHSLSFRCTNEDFYVALDSSMGLALLVWVGGGLLKRVLCFFGNKPSLD